MQGESRSSREMALGERAVVKLLVARMQHDNSKTVIPEKLPDVIIHAISPNQNQIFLVIVIIITVIIIIIMCTSS